MSDFFSSYSAPSWWEGKGLQQWGLHHTSWLQEDKDWPAAARRTMYTGGVWAEGLTREAAHHISVTTEEHWQMLRWQSEANAALYPVAVQVFSRAAAFRWTLYGFKAWSGPWSALKKISPFEESLVYCPIAHLHPLGGKIRIFKDGVQSLLFCKKFSQVLWSTLLVRSLEFMSACHQRGAFMI